MAQIPVQFPGVAGAAVGGTTIAANDTMPNNGNTMIEFWCNSGSPISVTVKATGPCSLGSTHDVVIAVPANGRVIAGPFPVSRFSRTLTFSAVTGTPLVAFPYSTT